MYVRVLCMFVFDPRTTLAAVGKLLRANTTEYDFHESKIRTKAYSKMPEQQQIGNVHAKIYGIWIDMHMYIHIYTQIMLACQRMCRNSYNPNYMCIYMYLCMYVQSHKLNHTHTQKRTRCN